MSRRRFCKPILTVPENCEYGGCSGQTSRTGTVPTSSARGADETFTLPKAANKESEIYADRLACISDLNCGNAVVTKFGSEISVLYRIFTGKQKHLAPQFDTGM